MTLEKLAIAALALVASYIAITVTTVSIELAVLKERSDNRVLPKEFSEFKTEVTTELDRYNQWLGRLSSRLNKLETNE